MNRDHFVRIRSDILNWFREIPKGNASEWVVKNIVIPAPQTQSPGPFSFAGREYLIELVDFFSHPFLTDECAVFGSQSAKTTGMMAGLGYIIANAPSTCLWVAPSRDLVRSFSKTRWQPIVHASPALAAMVPTGAKRHDFAADEQQLGGSVVNFVGANSPGQLASRPVRVVILDETDKFPSNPRGEADAANLADQRTKAMASPKRVKTSTPTASDGLVWQAFLQGDRRRYQVPCPHCGKRVILGWSKTFQTLPLVGIEAWMAWDNEAKRQDGTWDFERVRNSARCECPHCGGHIREDHKTRIVREGVWVPTATSSSTYRSRHLPSLYASTPETSFGAMAVRFLQAKASMQGLQGFVNGDLAEPWESQDSRQERTEIILRGDADPLPGAPMRIMTVDCQQTSPHFYYVIRDWVGGGHSRLVWAGTVEEWESIREKQLSYGVIDTGTFIDSGWDTLNVYANCLRWGKPAFGGVGQLPIHIGWSPMKGREGTATWKRADGIPRIYGRGNAAQTGKPIQLTLFEFASDSVLDLLASLRGGEAKSNGVRWEVPDAVAHDEYWRQMDSKRKVARFTARTGRVVHEWAKRSKHSADHYLDCEVMQVVAAMIHAQLGWSVKRDGESENET
jgi:predicted RNA-binding Zn-ribbon protein involved in translation (DUF1610 family)